MRIARWVAYTAGGALVVAWIFTQVAWTLIVGLVLIFGAVISSGPEEQATNPEGEERR